MSLTALGKTLIMAPVGIALLVGDPAHAATACLAKSPPTVATVVELYTSEGCSSCPPADRWLSAAQRQPGVVAVAFHVDYWDRLGWKDRFASAAYTRRQSDQLASNGARFSYTPQVVVDGIDQPDWPRARVPTAPARPADVDIVLKRDADRVTATVLSRSNAPRRLAGYWAVTENGHATTVKAGENDGATLHHDAVVRAYVALDAWSAAPNDERSFRFDAGAGRSDGAVRQVGLVIVDAATRRPVQAVELGC